MDIITYQNYREVSAIIIYSDLPLGQKSKIKKSKN